MQNLPVWLAGLLALTTYFGGQLVAWFSETPAVVYTFDQADEKQAFREFPELQSNFADSSGVNYWKFSLENISDDHLFHNTVIHFSFRTGEQHGAILKALVRKAISPTPFSDEPVALSDHDRGFRIPRLMPGGKYQAILAVQYGLPGIKPAVYIDCEDAMWPVTGGLAFLAKYRIWIYTIVVLTGIFGCVVYLLFRLFRKSKKEVKESEILPLLQLWLKQEINKSVTDEK